MITARDLAYGLYGAWRLAHFDRSGMQYFETTVEAFWKSFFAAVLVLPAFAILHVLTIVTIPAAAPSAGPLRVIVVFAIVYVISWVAFPLVMAKLAELLDRRDRFIPYIVARNWATIIEVGIVLPVTTLAAINSGEGANPTMQGVSQLLQLAATVAVLVYGWFITRAALDIPGLAAAGIVALDVTLIVLINRVGDAMVGSF